MRATRLAAVIAIGSASLVLAACAAFMSNLEGDPIGNWEMRAARVPVSSAGCVSICKQRDEACFQHLNDPGMQGNAQEAEQCYEAMYVCYMGCPGATQKIAQYQQLRLSEAMAAACHADLPPGQAAYCMTRNGIIGQAFDP